ncbi:MAG: hypothetical protein KAJ97_10280 [Acidobacteria bacterium]|nr:hypothetical protein [Acidobacteriota bacterium]
MTLSVGLPLHLSRVVAGHDVVVYQINAQQTAASLGAGEVFPNMRARVDGREVEASTDPTTGLLGPFMPAGSHAVHWSWQPFPALCRARGVTLLAFLMTVALGLTATAEKWSDRGRHELR